MAVSGSWWYNDEKASIYTARPGESERQLYLRLFKDGNYVGDYFYDEQDRKWVWNYDPKGPKYEWYGVYKDGKKKASKGGAGGSSGGVVTISSNSARENVGWLTSGTVSNIEYNFNTSTGTVTTFDSRTGEIKYPDLGSVKADPLAWLDKEVSKICRKALS